MTDPYWDQQGEQNHQLEWAMSGMAFKTLFWPAGTVPKCTGVAGLPNRVPRPANGRWRTAGDRFPTGVGLVPGSSRTYTRTISELPHLRRYRTDGHSGHLTAKYGITSAVLPFLRH